MDNHYPDTSLIYRTYQILTYMKTPVIFIIFKRFDSAKRVFDVIRQAKPPKLLVVADGPRSGHDDEPEKCAAARSIIEQVDWDCEVLTNYSDRNMGCRRRFTSGLDWAFQNVEEAIILEDDCLPHISFFPFCDSLLEHYRYDTRVMHIAGTNFAQVGRNLSESYYFSRLTYCWGWATWRRAWQYFDASMKALPDLISTPGFIEMLGSKKEAKERINTFLEVYKHEVDAWDYQWQFACLSQGSVSIVPNRNLIRNIGFGSDSTHTFNPDSPIAKLQLESIKFPLVHPQYFIRDMQADSQYIARAYDSRLSTRIKQKIVRTTSKLGRIAG